MRNSTVSELDVEINDQICTNDADCIRVQNTCSSCECGVPVNKIHEQKYIEKIRKICENYHGGVCDALMVYVVLVTYHQKV